MAQKKRRPDKKRLPEHKLSNKQASRLQDAQAMMRMGRWREAAEALEEFDLEHPHLPEVMMARLEVAQHFKDYHQIQELCERLLPHRPRDPRLFLQFGAICMQNLRPALALRTFRTFLERWPDHPEGGKARDTVASLEEIFHEQAKTMGFAGSPDPLQLAVWHEELQAHLENGRYAQCYQTADKLLQVCPQFSPALNNSGEAYWRQGNPENAIACARRVLAFEPDNLHALANLTRYLALFGRPDEAKESAQRLRSLKTNADGWIKIAETFTYLGDDAAVLEALENVRLSGEAITGLNLAMTAHFGAVAAYRQVREDEARQLWQVALRAFPGYEAPRGNLADLRKPIEERHAAWPFEMPYWLPIKLVEDFVERTQAAGKRKAGDDRAAARLFLEQHPELAALVPILLDRGDEHGRYFALQLAKIARTPAMLEALHQFASSQRGPDKHRIEAANVAGEAGLINGPIRFWGKGKWSEVLIVSFEINDALKHHHTEAVTEMVRHCHDLLLEGQGSEAESILRRALELEPDAPDIMNNLAAALDLQKRRGEYEALIHEIHAKHPDYFFGRTNMARLEIRAGRFKEAQALLEPLLLTRRLHSSEFRALAMAEIELALAKGQQSGAEYWLQMVEQFLPGDPQLPAMRQFVKGFGLADLFSHRKS